MTQRCWWQFLSLVIGIWSLVILTDMIPFDFQPRTRIVFGPDKLDALGELAHELGARRAMLVSDEGVIKPGHAERGIDSLEKAGILDPFTCIR